MTEIENNPHQALIEETQEKMLDILHDCIQHTPLKLSETPGDDYHKGYIFYQDMVVRDVFENESKVKALVQATIDTVLEKQWRKLSPFMQHDLQCATEFEVGDCDCGLKEALTPKN